MAQDGSAVAVIGIIALVLCIVAVISVVAALATSGVAVSRQNSTSKVTQTSSPSTAVTFNTRNGTITTVSVSTAAGGSFQFTVNNERAKTTSVFQVTASTAGTGSPLASILNMDSRSFVIKVQNVHATDAFNNTIVLTLTQVK